ncbi:MULTISPECIES: Uma2 family endonuclease [Sorangium]|uniref:Uma2 family endonuclease n=1 Tax=Sorangium TaxID=39643 RepID=UPI003D9C0526
MFIEERRAGCPFFRACDTYPLFEAEYESLARGRGNLDHEVMRYMDHPFRTWEVVPERLVGLSREHSGRKPDASAYMPQRRKPPRRRAINAPPDIMVEVVSPTPRDARRDRVEEPHEYASFGVRWYWIIDPQERTLEILELGADRRYVHARSAADGIVASVSGLEGLSLDLDALWREVELLGPESGEGTLRDPVDQ